MRGPISPGQPELGIRVDTVLTDANLDNADLSYASLFGATTTGLTVTGAWLHATCPDETQADNDGGTCVNYLGPPPGSAAIGNTRPGR